MNSTRESNQRTAVAVVDERPQRTQETSMRWFMCGADDYLHVVGPCPRCWDDKWGLLLGTMTRNFNGRTTTACAACGERVDYYVDAQQQTLWKMEEVEEIEV